MHEQMGGGEGTHNTAYKRHCTAVPPRNPKKITRSAGISARSCLANYNACPVQMKSANSYTTGKKAQHFLSGSLLPSFAHKHITPFAIGSCACQDSFQVIQAVCVCMSHGGRFNIIPDTELPQRPHGDGQGRKDQGVPMLTGLETDNTVPL